MEEAAAALSQSIDAGRKDKSQLLADIVETEKQVIAAILACGHSPSFAQCCRPPHWLMTEKPPRMKSLTGGRTERHTAVVLDL